MIVMAVRRIIFVRWCGGDYEKVFRMLRGSLASLSGFLSIRQFAFLPSVEKLHVCLWP